MTDITETEPGTAPQVPETPTGPTDAEFAALQTRVSTLETMLQRVEALEAWTCRRPHDAIPQPFIDLITADAIASVTPPAEPEPTDPEEVPDGVDEDGDVPNGE